MVAEKKDGTVQICIDSVHLNKALRRPRRPPEIYRTNPCTHALCQCSVFWLPNVFFGRSPLITLLQSLQLSCHPMAAIGSLECNLAQVVRCSKIVVDSKDEILIWGCTQLNESLRRVLNRICHHHLEAQPW